MREQDAGGPLQLVQHSDTSPASQPRFSCLLALHLWLVNVLMCSKKRHSDISALRILVDLDDWKCSAGDMMSIWVSKCQVCLIASQAKNKYNKLSLKR